MEQRKNVYQLALERIELIFKEFDNVYISFSGGKDSSVLLQLCIDYIRKHNLKRKLGVLHLDYEIQYQMTLDYIDQVFEENQDILEVYRVCVPFKVQTCTSMHQSYWRPWDEKMKELWVRSMPEKHVKTASDFPFFNEAMWDYDFQLKFSSWYHQKKKAIRTACLVGIRTQESFIRWQSIYGNNRKQQYHQCQWSLKVACDVYNFYPIFDWKTTDIWTANGKFKWPYNKLYDLYYQAGVNIERQRVASPFISEAIESLHLYKCIDPNTWGKMISRVNGVNFTGYYGTTYAMGRNGIKLPQGYTWKSYMEFLLSTLPENIKRNYLEKLHTSIKFWRTKGGCLSEETIQQLLNLGVPIEVRNHTNYKTKKKPVVMEYLDDINIPNFREIPTYKRMCMCILRNDHACKYMGFALNKKEAEMKDYILKHYKDIWN